MASKKALKIGLALSAVVGATIACSRADVSIPPPEEEVAVVVQRLGSDGAGPTPTQFQSLSSATPTEVPTEIPELTPTDTPEPIPTTEPTPTEEPWPEDIQVLEGVVIQDAFLVDADGEAPFEDSYFVTLLRGCEPFVVEFKETRTPDGTPPYWRTALDLEPGEKVRIHARAAPEAYEGLLLESLGEGALSEWCSLPLDVEFAVTNVEYLKFLPHYWSMLQDGHLIESVLSRTALPEQEELAQQLYEKLVTVDDRYSPVDPSAVFELSYVDLIRLYLIREYLTDSNNLAALGVMLEEDVADTTGEHGGLVLLTKEGVEVELVPNLCVQDCDDFQYLFTAQDWTIDVVAHLHFHASDESYNSATISDPDKNVQVVPVGLMISKHGGNRFNVTLYRESLVINLGPYSYPSSTPLPDVVQTWQDLCSEPGQCAQTLLDGGWIHYEDDQEVYGVGNFGAGPALSLEKMAGDSEDMVMAIAASLLDDGYPPLALLLATDNYAPNNLVIYPYRENGLWGYVSVTRRNSQGTVVGTHVVDVEPRFESMEGLFKHYQDLYPWKHPYTRYFLIDLDSVPDWLTTTDHIEFTGGHVIADNNPHSDVPAEPDS